MAKINDFLIPQVNEAKSNVSGNKVNQNKLAKGQESEFKNYLDSLSGGIHVSKHAQNRMMERNIDFGSDEYLKVKTAMDNLKNKGGKDSLIITPNAAYIVDVKNNKLVTAVDKNSLRENVFTNIDSTIIVD